MFVHEVTGIPFWLDSDRALNLFVDFQLQVRIEDLCNENIPSVVLELLSQKKNMIYILKHIHLFTKFDV